MPISLPPTDSSPASKDTSEHLIGGSQQTTQPQKPLAYPSVMKEQLSQKAAADRAFANARYLKLQEEIRALQRKREEEDHKRLGAIEEEKKAADIQKKQQQPLGVTSPFSALPVYRTEQKAGKARE